MKCVCHTIYTLNTFSFNIYINIYFATGASRNIASAYSTLGSFIRRAKMSFKITLAACNVTTVFAHIITDHTILAHMIFNRCTFSYFTFSNIFSAHIITCANMTFDH